RVARAVGEGQGNEADRQPTLGRRALELGARSILGSARSRRIEHHEREGTLAIPDAAAGRSDGTLDGGPTEHYLRLATRTGTVGLDVARRVIHEARERRILGRLAAASRTHQRLAHRLLQGRRRLSFDVDLVGAHGPSCLAWQSATEQHE